MAAAGLGTNVPVGQQRQAVFAALPNFQMPRAAVPDVVLLTLVPKTSLLVSRWPRGKGPFRVPVLGQE